MIVHKSRRFAVRRYRYVGSGIVSTIGSLLATKAMLATATKAALKGSPKTANRAVPYLIAHKVVSIIADAAKKGKRVVSVEESFCGYRT